MALANAGGRAGLRLLSGGRCRCCCCCIVASLLPPPPHCCTATPAEAKTYCLVPTTPIPYLYNPQPSPPTHPQSPRLSICTPTSPFVGTLPHAAPGNPQSRAALASQPYPPAGAFTRAPPPCRTGPGSTPLPYQGAPSRLLPPPKAPPPCETG